MYRPIFGLGLLIAAGIYVRHQFHKVMAEVTKPTTQSFLQTSRRQCLMCGGTGRTRDINLTGKKRPFVSQPCPTCNGTGWVGTLPAK